MPTGGSLRTRGISIDSSMLKCLHWLMTPASQLRSVSLTLVTPCKPEVSWVHFKKILHWPSSVLHVSWADPKVCYEELHEASKKNLFSLQLLIYCGGFTPAPPLDETLITRHVSHWLPWLLHVMETDFMWKLGSIYCIAANQWNGCDLLHFKEQLLQCCLLEVISTQPIHGYNTVEQADKCCLLCNLSIPGP